MTNLNPGSGNSATGEARTGGETVESVFGFVIEGSTVQSDRGPGEIMHLHPYVCSPDISPKYPSRTTKSPL
jgi:hypothetical protein